MKFVNPYFLIALASIAIPIIIHLFNFRRFKKIYFSNVEFLKELKQETQKKSKIKHLLILASRILAVSCLVFAFAQPYIPFKDNKINAKGNLISVYIDNSFSMEALSSKGTLFDDAKSKALEIANAYKSTDLFQLLTNDFEGKHQNYVTKEEFLQMLNEIEISPSFRKLSEVITRQNDLFFSMNSKGKKAFIISDFSKEGTDILNIKEDTNVDVNLIPLVSNKTDNLYIDSCWFLSPVMQVNKQVQLNVLVRNSSGNDAEKIPVKLVINGKQKTVASIDIPANSEAVVKLPYTIAGKGTQFGSVEIIDYPIIFDDKFYFSYNVSENIPILSINENSGSVYINALFGKDSAFVLANTEINKLDYSLLPNYKLIILNEVKTLSSGLMQELQQYVRTGGSLLVFPSPDADLDNYKNFLTTFGSIYYSAKDTTKTKVSTINTDHEIFKDVFDKIPENIDLPVVKTHFKFNAKTFSSEEFILKMQNGESFMISEKSGKGKIIMFVVFTSLIIIVITTFFFLSYSRHQPVNLSAVEIKDYQGEKLGSINDFRENSIKGPQYVDRNTYHLDITGYKDTDRIAYFID